MLDLALFTEMYVDGMFLLIAINKPCLLRSVF